MASVEDSEKPLDEAACENTGNISTETPEHGADTEPRAESSSVDNPVDESRNILENETFHRYIGESPENYKADVHSDEEMEVGKPAENEDLPDLYSYLRGLEEGHTDLENDREPPSLFNRPEHLQPYKSISTLKHELKGTKLPQYVDEFESHAKDDALMIANISLEEIQEEERRMRDEQIAFQQQELEKQQIRKNELSKLESTTKKRLNKDNKEKRRQLARLVEVARQKEQLQIDLLHKSFERAEMQLQKVLRKRKREVKLMYGNLVSADGDYGGAQGRRWKVDWDKTQQPVQIKLSTLRGVKDKLPAGRYVVMVSLYNRLGGHVMQWSQMKEQKWGGAALPVIHDGKFYNSEMKINQNLFTVLPSKPSIRPGMIITFELYLLKGNVVNTDRVVAWGCFPICDGTFEVVEGKYKAPMLRGEMDFQLEKHSQIEEIIATDLDHWMCNTYFEIVRLPRYVAGQKEYEVELQFSSALVNHPDRINLDGEEYKDSENPVLGSAIGSQFEMTTAGSTSEVASVGQTTSNKASSIASLDKMQSDIEDETEDSLHSKALTEGGVHPPRRHVAAVDTGSIQGDNKVVDNVESDSSIDEEDIFVLRKGKDEFEAVEGELGLYSKRHLNNPVDIYTKKLYSTLPKVGKSKKKLKAKRTYAEQLEEHTVSVKSQFSEKGRVAERGWKRVSYLARMFMAELGLSQWTSREFWAMLILFVFTFFLRIYLHYTGQFLYLTLLGIPINSFNFLPYTVHLNYQSSLLHVADEVLIVLIGPMTVFLMFAICVALAWLCQKIMGIFPDIGCKFVLMFGLQSVFNPILLIIVDAAQQTYDYNTQTTARPLADFSKLYWFFMRTQGSGLGGAFVTIFLYLFVMFLSGSVLYMYFLRLHNNGRMLDIYWRLHSQIEQIFIPYDLEMSLQELDYICLKAEQWRGEDGARRKVAVYDYVWEEEETDFAAFDDTVETAKNQKEKQTKKQGNKKEKTSHIAIHTLHTDGLRELYRHFLVLPDGAIVEVFGEMSYIPGLTKDMKKAINSGAKKLERVMDFGSTASITRMKGKVGGLHEDSYSLHTPVTGRGIHVSVNPAPASAESQG